MNGAAERVYRTLLNLARSMLYSAKLPPNSGQKQLIQRPM